MQRQRFEMTPEDLAALLDACRPVPYIVVGGYEPTSPQENANRAWRNLAARLGFEWETVQAVPGEPQTVFTAIPTARADSP